MGLSDFRIRMLEISLHLLEISEISNPPRQSPRKKLARSSPVTNKLEDLEILAGFSLPPLKFQKPSTKERKRGEKNIYLQCSNKILRRASDHGPATWVHRVLIPIVQNPMRIIQLCSNTDQSLHYQNIKISKTNKKNKTHISKSSTNEENVESNQRTPKPTFWVDRFKGEGRAGQRKKKE